MKICGVYKITNAITGDFYIGSSKDVKHRWATHKCPSVWNKCPNNQLYKDMQKYGIDNFSFQILTEVEADSLKEAEQKFIETFKPTYNNRNANGWDFERLKKTHRNSNKQYRQSDKGKEAQNKYHKSDKYKKYQKEYRQSDKGKEYHKQYDKEYNNQLCCYNGETLTLCALSTRFRRKGINNPTTEAKKYLV